MSVMYKIRFKQAAQIEHAHADKAKGGYWIEPIPVGTEKTVNEASFRFWDRKGVIDLLGKIDEPGVLNPFMAAQYAQVDPFALLGAEPQKSVPTTSETEIDDMVVCARKAIEESDRTGLHAALTELSSDEVAAAIPKLSQDAHIVIEAAIDDLNAGKPVDVRELGDALTEVITQIRK
jgi:hypothetical protein